MSAIISQLPILIHYSLYRTIWHLWIWAIHLEGSTWQTNASWTGNSFSLDIFQLILSKQFLRIEKKKTNWFNKNVLFFRHLKRQSHTWWRSAEISAKNNYHFVYIKWVPVFFSQMKLWSSFFFSLFYFFIISLLFIWNCLNLF